MVPASLLPKAWPWAWGEALWAKGTPAGCGACGLDLHDPQSGSEAAHIGCVRGYDDITARCGDQRDLPIDRIGRARRRQ